MMPVTLTLYHFFVKHILSKRIVFSVRSLSDFEQGAMTAEA